jgi:hypothetical protein
VREPFLTEYGSVSLAAAAARTHRPTESDVFLRPFAFLWSDGGIDFIDGVTDRIDVYSKLSHQGFQVRDYVIPDWLSDKPRDRIARDNLARVPYLILLASGGPTSSFTMLTP